MPVADANAGRLNLRAAGTEPLDPHPRILLIEDDRDLEDTLRMILEDQGYAVVVAHAPAAAITLLAAMTFDLIITDGFSRAAQDVVANTAAVLAAAGATPVVLFSAHRIERDAARLAGFRDVIPKPFDLETLERQVRTLFNPRTPTTDGDVPPAAVVTHLSQRIPVCHSLVTAGSGTV
jgi:two-component system response regulator MprA